MYDRCSFISGFAVLVSKAGRRNLLSGRELCQKALLHINISCGHIEIQVCSAATPYFERPVSYESLLALASSFVAAVALLFVCDN